MVIKQLELQEFLFEREPTRMDLLNYAASVETSYRVFICRNHSFELIENTIKPYLEYGGVGVEFLYSSYDDSLSFLELDPNVDMVILWLDLSNYKMPDLAGFIDERVKHLRSLFQGNILFVPCCNDAKVRVDNQHAEQYKLTSLEERLDDRFLDLRLEPFSGTKLSNAASLAIARDLGLNYLPALLQPNLKCIVVDLDNTLYQGVLGEDGVTGVVLTNGHYRLQARLKDLSEQGYFLSIASKNDARDVVQLFDERSDFALKLTDFVEVHANWNNKSDSIGLIAEALNISSNSMLFIDDNMGELVSVAQGHPDINLLWAKDDPLISHEILANYPGLLKFKSKREDSLRKQDTIANKRRSQIQNSMSREDYIRDLKMELVYDIDNSDYIDRVTELSNKTNQFIFSYQRYTQEQIKILMASDDSTVVAVSLTDRLSESGIVGVVVVKRAGQVGVLEECFVSCRALGRGIDQAIVLGAISAALDSMGLAKLKVNFTNGGRNLPAETFSKEHLNSYIEPIELTSSGDFEYQVPTDLITVKIKQGKLDE